MVGKNAKQIVGVLVIPLGATLYWLLGAIIAVPIAAARRVIVEEAFMPRLHARAFSD